MKCLVLYRSKYGSTARYAHWLAEALQGEAVDAGQNRKLDLAPYAAIIYGGGVYAGGILGFHKIKPALQQSKKPVFLFAVGATQPCPEVMETLRDRIKPEEVPARLFYLRGAFDMAKMHAADRMMIRILQKSLSKKPRETLEPWARDMLDNQGRSADWTDRQALAPLIEAIRQNA